MGGWGGEGGGPAGSGTGCRLPGSRPPGPRLVPRAVRALSPCCLARGLSLGYKHKHHPQGPAGAAAGRGAGPERGTIHPLFPWPPGACGPRGNEAAPASSPHGWARGRRAGPAEEWRGPQGGRKRAPAVWTENPHPPTLHPHRGGLPCAPWRPRLEHASWKGPALGRGRPAGGLLPPQGPQTGTGSLLAEGGQREAGSGWLGSGPRPTLPLAASQSPLDRIEGTGSTVHP